MSTAKIRPFDETDRSELRTLFARAGDGVPPGSFWGHPEAEASVYLDPYMDLEPESLFVAEADGALVGYLTGCLDSATFPSEGARMEFAIRKYRLALRPQSMVFFGRAIADTVRTKLRKEPATEDFHDPRWPSHLHINVVPEARGTGAGSALMEAWFDRWTQAGSPGCYLQTLVENPGAVRFFQRMGFTAYGPSPLVPGVRYNGKRLHQQTMVQSAPELG